MKKMLINATQKEELRVALVENKILVDLDIERQGNVLSKANIYKGKISKVTPSLDAVFVDLGEERHGFLPIKEIAIDAFLNLKDHERKLSPGHGSELKSFLREGQELLVQVTRPARGGKGSALTTFISLAGSYLVLMPNNPKAHGISRRIEGDERQTLKNLFGQLHHPKGMGLIVRTAGVSKSSEELIWDLESLLNYWKAIQEAAARSPSPSLIHQEGNIVSRVVRDYLVRDIDEIIVDEQETFESLKAWIQWFKPEFLNRLKFYASEVPIFSRDNVEEQIETAFQREVKLPSGGMLIIDRTEALTAIDVNSARSTRCQDIEATATNTNIEAAAEIARQLRLRDLGGLIVIDFIDMKQESHQQALEEQMRGFIKKDRARVQLSGISKFGLMEVSRQRLRQALDESHGSLCPRCLGSGILRDDKSLALSILRILEIVPTCEEDEAICAMVPVGVASFLLNEKREALDHMEKHLKRKVYILPKVDYLTPQYTLFALSQKNDPKFLLSEDGIKQHEKGFRWIQGHREEGPWSQPTSAISWIEPAEQTTLPKAGMVSEILCATRMQKRPLPTHAPNWFQRCLSWFAFSKKRDTRLEKKMSQETGFAETSSPSADLPDREKGYQSNKRNKQDGGGVSLNKERRRAEQSRHQSEGSGIRNRGSASPSNQPLSPADGAKSAQKNGLKATPEASSSPLPSIRSPHAHNGNGKRGKESKKASEMVESRPKKSDRPLSDPEPLSEKTTSTPTAPSTPRSRSSRRTSKNPAPLTNLTRESKAVEKVLAPAIPEPIVKLAVETQSDEALKIRDPAVEVKVASKPVIQKRASSMSMALKRELQPASSCAETLTPVAEPCVVVPIQSPRSRSGPRRETHRAFSATSTEMDDLKI